jgi:hypothetical protein
VEAEPGTAGAGWAGCATVVLGTSTVLCAGAGADRVWARRPGRSRFLATGLSGLPAGAGSTSGCTGTGGG